MPLFPVPSPPAPPPSTVIPSTGVCSPWAKTTDLCEPCTDYTFDPTLIANSLQIASDVLFNLTGRQWPGVCTDTVRPTGREMIYDHGRPVRSYGTEIIGYVDPGWLAAGGGFGVFGGNQTERGGGYPVSEVTLGAYPVTSIIQVVIGGQVVDPTQYRIDDNRYLTRLPDPVTFAPRFWPCYPRPDEDASGPDAFQVTFTYGTPPPQGGVHACALYACQLALSASPVTVGRCQLPAQTKAITRTGLSVAVNNPADLVRDGMVGLIAVDQWVHSVNPAHIQRRMTVMSPDSRRRVRRPGPHG